MTMQILRQEVQGAVIARADTAYASAREGLLFNQRTPDRQPQMIVKARSVGDVQAVVRHAAASGQRISVRGGGHNWSGIALQESILLDLSGLDHLRVDAAARLADVGPGVRNGDAARALAEHGLAFPFGHCATVPLSGYLLGGGIGWNSGEWGMACFNVESVEVVTADGEIRRASSTENADIFWAVRGAGPEFFGVVTGYRLRLYPLPRAITTSGWTYPIGDAAVVEQWMKESMAAVPRNVEFTFIASNAPPPLAGKVATGIATVFADTEAEARETLARIAAMAPAGALDIQENLPTPFDVLYGIIAQFLPEGHRYAVDSFWAAPKAEGFLRRLAEETVKARSPRSFSLGVVLPPAAVSTALPDAAFSAIGPEFGCSYAIWQDEAEDDGNIAWIRETARSLAPVVAGHYVGEAYLDDPARLRGCYAAPAWDRLKTLQATYDPAGIFRAHRPSAERIADADSAMTGAMATVASAPQREAITA